MKMNRTVKGVGLALVLLVSISYAAVNGVFNNVSAAGFVHSVTEMTAPFFHGLADTASALAATPTQCGGGTPIATGIAANGNANCTATPPIVGAVSSNFSRAVNTTYQNTSSSMVFASGFFSTSGSAETNLTCFIGPSSATTPVAGWQYGATTGSANAGFNCLVPAGWFYQIAAAGSATLTAGSWYETTIQ